MRTWHGRPVWSTMKPAHLYFYVPCETETVNCGETCCLNSWTSALHVWTSFLLTTTHSLTHSLKHSSCLDKLPPHNTLTHSTFTPTDNKTSSHSQQLHCYCSRHLLHKIYHLSVTYFYVISQYNLGYKYISIIPDTYIIILIHVSSSIEVQEIHYWEKSITLVIESVDCDWLSVLPLL